jgi:hypothetical protein
LVCAAGLALLGALSAPAADEPAAPRIEARSANLLAVGIAHGDRMSIRLSRLADNAPLRDAVLNVLLRGVVHPAVAEADGSYTVQTQDLAVPGAASMEFQVLQGQAREDLKGELVVADGQSKPEQKNSARQLWWWALNFAVCIGFLMLLSRRRKAAKARDTTSHD